MAKRNGHFTKKNAKNFGARGGNKRAKALSSAERSRIARLGGLARQQRKAASSPPRAV